MRQKILKESSYNQLISQFRDLTESQVLKEYTKESFSFQENALVETDLIVENPISLDLSNRTGADDFQNAISLFETFSQLTPAEATDAKLWTTLAHYDCWGYMRKRWPAEVNSAKSNKEYIEQRYFIKSINSKNLLRHGISRLWWMVYLTYNDGGSNPYELTEEVFSMLDYTTHLLSGVQGRNRNFSRAILKFVIKNKELFEKYKESRVRFVLRKLNYMAGYKVFSVLPENDITIFLEDLKKDIEDIND